MEGRKAEQERKIHCPLLPHMKRKGDRRGASLSGTFLHVGSPPHASSSFGHFSSLPSERSPVPGKPRRGRAEGVGWPPFPFPSWALIFHLAVYPDSEPEGRNMQTKSAPAPSPVTRSHNSLDTKEPVEPRPRHSRQTFPLLVQCRSVDAGLAQRGEFGVAVERTSWQPRGPGVHDACAVCPPLTPPDSPSPLLPMTSAGSLLLLISQTHGLVGVSSLAH